MAKTIGELLRQNRQTGGSVTSAIEDIGRVRSTGKLTPGGQRRGDVVEDAQQAELLRQRGEMLGDLSYAEKMRAEQAQAFKTEQMGTRASAAQKYAETKQRFDLMAKDLLDDLERGRQKMTTQEEIQAVEMAGAAQRLANDKYLYELQNTGRKERLQDALAFDNALKKAVFEDEIDLLRDNIAFNELMDADDAAFTKMLADIDINTALQIAASDAKAVNRRAIIGAVGTTASEAGKWGYDYMKSKPKTTNTTNNETGIGSNTILPKNNVPS